MIDYCMLLDPLRRRRTGSGHQIVATHSPRAEPVWKCLGSAKPGPSLNEVGDHIKAVNGKTGDEMYEALATKPNLWLSVQTNPPVTPPSRNPVGDLGDASNCPATRALTLEKSHPQGLRTEKTG